MGSVEGKQTLVWLLVDLKRWYLTNVFPSEGFCGWVCIILSEYKQHGLLHSMRLLLVWCCKNTDCSFLSPCELCFLWCIPSLHQVQNSSISSFRMWACFFTCVLKQLSDVSAQVLCFSETWVRKQCPAQTCFYFSANTAKSICYYLIFRKNSSVNLWHLSNTGS